MKEKDKKLAKNPWVSKDSNTPLQKFPRCRRRQRSVSDRNSLGEESGAAMRL